MSDRPMSGEPNISDELTRLMACACGGFHAMSANWRGCEVYRCPLCGSEIAAKEPESYRTLLDAKRQTERVKEIERRASLPPPPPPEPPLRDGTREEALIIAAYENWSEDVYCASFLMPSESGVESFIAWLDARAVIDTESEADLVRWYAERTDPTA